MKKIGYIKGLEKFATQLEEFGFELFPYENGISFDALIYSESENSNLFSTLSVEKKPLFLLNVHNKSVSTSAEILNKQLYSSMF